MEKVGEKILAGLGCKMRESVGTNTEIEEKTRGRSTENEK